MQLLGYGAKVDATGHKGRTALQQLLKHGDLLDAKMLTLLLDAGASPFVADNSGMLHCLPVWPTTQVCYSACLCG